MQFIKSQFANLVKEPSVKPETVVKVTKGIAQLNYQPNTAARNLASTNPYAIGYVYDNPNAYYVINMQNGILNYFCVILVTSLFRMRYTLRHKMTMPWFIKNTEM